MPDKSKLPDDEKSKVETLTEEAPAGVKTTREFDSSAWTPKTILGKKVKSGEIKDIAEIFFNQEKILETEIVDMLVKDLSQELLSVGQSKGKFGGGKKNVWRQTQKKSSEGNKPQFSTVIAIGNKNGYIGLGRGKAKETMPAREKASKKSKLNLISIRRGCGAWACGCKDPHTIPFKVEARCGSIRIILKPAPKGTGLKVEKECSKILELAGIKDVYSKTYGHTCSKVNLVSACFKALSKLSSTKIPDELLKDEGVIEGEIKDGR